MAETDPPPLPPPTVPSDPLLLPPPPSPPRPPPAHLAFGQPSAPLPTSPSSIAAVAHAAASQVPSDSEEDDRPSGSVDPAAKRMLESGDRTRIQFFTGHSVAEAGRSAWFDTRLLLVFRLAVSAFLVSHLVFFSLNKDVSFRLYATWSFAGLTFAFVFVLMCSLVEVLRMGEVDEDDDADSEPRDEEEGAVRAVDHEAMAEPRDSGLSYMLAQVSVPMYQLFVTAMLFSAVVYWAAINTSDPARVSYAIMAVHVGAPVVALVDMFLSMSMRFRFVYVPLFVLYNGAYAMALYAFYRLDDIYLYRFLDPSLQERSTWIAKVAGLSVATVMAALLLCAVSIARDLSFVRKRRDKIHAAKSKIGDSEDGDHSGEISPSSEGTLDSSRCFRNKREDRAVGVESDRTGEGAVELREQNLEDRLEGGAAECEYGGLAVEEVDLSRSASQEQRDRLSVPILSRGSSLSGVNGSRRWQRLSSSGKVVSSRSGSSIGEGEGLVRSESRNSAWDLELDSMQAKPEEEYFTMPGVYNVHGEEEVVKLAPIVRSSSGSGPRLSRSGSHRLSRASSSGAMARSRSGSGFGRDSGLRIFRSSSGRQLKSDSAGGEGQQS